MLKRKLNLIFILFISSFSFLATAEESLNQDKIKIGAVLSLSGEVSWFGQAAREGMELAMAEAGENKFVVEYEDDLSLDKRSIISSVRRIINRKQAEMLFVTAVNSAATINSIVEPAKLPTLVMIDSNESLNSMSKYIFGFGFSNEAAGEDMADYAVKMNFAGRTGIISAHDEWSEVIAASFKKRIEERGGKVAVNEQVDLNESDLRAVIAKLKGAGVESVYFPLYKSSIVSFVKQARELDLKAQLLTAEGLSQSEVAQLGAAAEGILLTQAILDNADFKARYEKHFNKSSADINLSHVALGFDAVQFALAACQEKERLSTNLRDAVSQLHFEGVLGSIHYGKSRLSNRREKVVVVKNGNFEIAGN